MVIGLRPCSNERELTRRYPIVVAVFMVEGTFGRERRADIGVGRKREKEREQRMVRKGEKRGDEEGETEKWSWDV